MKAPLSAEALDACEALTLADHTDWRLPNVRELQSIVNYRRWGPAIDLVFTADSSWYWSSSTLADFPNGAWNVHFNYGLVVWDTKDVFSHVRAVRGRP